MQERIDAIYARQAIDKADSISIESQIEFCNYELKGGACKEYTDKGYSGKNTDRPQFQNLIQDIEQGRIRKVIVYKLDRISRSILDFANIMGLFEKYKVEFVSSTEKFDTETPMGRAMLNICIVFAQLERETIQRRVRDAYLSRSRKGFHMGGKTPYGFLTEPIQMEGINTKKLVAHPEVLELYVVAVVHAPLLTDCSMRTEDAPILVIDEGDCTTIFTDTLPLPVGLQCKHHVGNTLHSCIIHKHSKGLFHNKPFQPFLPHGFLLAASPILSRNALVIVMNGLVSARAALAHHKGLKTWQNERNCESQSRVISKGSNACPKQIPFAINSFHHIFISRRRFIPQNPLQLLDGVSRKRNPLWIIYV